MDINQKICKHPGCTEPAGHNHYKAWCKYHGNLKRNQDKNRYRARHPESRLHDVICRVCGTTFKSKGAVMCIACREKYDKLQCSTNQYVGIKTGGIKYDRQRFVAKELGLIKSSRDIVHHVDWNKGNNSPENLLVLDVADHNALHAFLKAELIKNPQADIKSLTWNFIWQNYIPHCYCNNVPSDYELDDM